MMFPHKPYKLDNCTSTCIKDLACNCCTVTYRDIDEVLYHTKNYVSSISMEHNLYLTKKLGSPKTYLIPKLNYYIWALEKELELLYRNIKSCLKLEQLCDLLAKVKRILPINCFQKKRRDDIKTAIPGYTGCMGTESWTRHLYQFCDDFNIQIDRASVINNEEICQLSMAVIREQIPHTLMYSLSRIPKNCVLELETNRSNQKCDLVLDLTKLEECKAEYEILRTKHDCRLTYSGYVELIKCGLDFKFIDDAFNCGFEVCVTDTKNKCDLTYGDAGYPTPCNITYSEYLSDRDVCLERNTQTFNIGSINIIP